jgi:hypothetical protein
VFVDVMDGADIGMVQSRCGLSFTAEARHGLRIARQFRGQELEGYEAMQAGVFGLVHHAHAAAAQLFQDAVVGDGLANHGAASCRGVLAW